MKRSRRRVEAMQRTLEKLTDHRRRAAAVATLLTHCDGEAFEDWLLGDVGGLIADEMQAIRECTEILYRETLR